MGNQSSSDGTSTPQISSQNDVTLSKKRKREEEDSETAEQIAAADEETSSTQEQQQPKKKKKKKQKSDETPQITAVTPKIGGTYFSVFGNDAHPSIQLKLSEYFTRREPRLDLQDIQDLIMWILSDGVSLGWAFVQNKSLIKKIVVIAVNSLDLDTYVENRELLPALDAIGSQACMMHPPWKSNRAPQEICRYNDAADYWKGRFLQQLFLRKKPKEKPAKKPAPTHNNMAGTLALIAAQQQQGQSAPVADESQEEDGVAAAAGEEAEQEAEDEAAATAAAAVVEPPFADAAETRYKLKRSDLMLAPSDLRDNDFPLELAPGYIELEENASSQHAAKLVAVDCEMCITEQGFELTRVTLVDEEGTCIYDKYVKPHNEIVNYNTRYSGITKEMLDEVETRLEDVQRELQQILCSSTILVGHSLENDLRALKIVHRRVIDTSVQFPHSKGAQYKNSLRYLAYTHLKRQIQTGKDGHDSIEDALAALDLVKQKLEHGWDYGSHQKEKLVPIFEGLNAAGRRAILIDEPFCLNKMLYSGISTASCLSDQETVSKSVGPMRGEAYQLVFTHLHDLEKHYAATAATAAAKEETAQEEMMDELAPSATDEKLKSVFRTMNDRIKTLYEAAPEDTLIIVTSSYGNLSRVKQLTDERSKVTDDGDLGDKTLALIRCVNRASAGVCFVGIKQKRQDAVALAEPS